MLTRLEGRAPVRRRFLALSDLAPRASQPGLERARRNPQQPLSAALLVDGRGGNAANWIHRGSIADDGGASTGTHSRRRKQGRTTKDMMVETAFSVLMSLFLCSAGVILVVLGRRMSQRRLPPNLWAGVRYQIALRSEENWYTMQARCATATMGMGAVFIDSALLFAIQAAMPETISILIPIIVMLVQTTAGIAILHVQARRCAAELTQSA